MTAIQVTDNSISPDTKGTSTIKELKSEQGKLKETSKQIEQKLKKIEIAIEKKKSLEQIGRTWFDADMCVKDVKTEENK